MVSESVPAVFLFFCYSYNYGFRERACSFCYGWMVLENVPVVCCYGCYGVRECACIFLFLFFSHGAMVSERMHSYCNSYKWMSLQL